MTNLDVHLGDQHVGTLMPTRKGARFRFDEEVVSQFTGRPLLSVALPVKARPYNEDLTGSWFCGLLPEGDRLDRLAREVGCDTTDYVSLLAEVGWECAGAVSIAPARSNSPVRSSTTRPLSSEELSKRLMAESVGGSAIGPVERVSLGGYQGKLCVVADGLDVEGGMARSASFALPDPLSVSTHILKPQPQGRHKGLIAGEAWALAAVRGVARCANVALLSLEGAPQTLVVERFDRATTDGKLMRIHQEDCCQALGLHPSQKYASASGPKGDDPSFAKIANVLTAYAIDAQEELCELARQMTVNLALGNVDAHAKNYALLYKTACVPSLSPMYDVAPIADVTPRAEHLSLRINGKVLWREVTRDDLVVEASSWGLGKKRASEVVEDVLDKLGQGIVRSNELYPSAADRFAAPAFARIQALG